MIMCFQSITKSAHISLLLLGNIFFLGDQLISNGKFTSF